MTSRLAFATAVAGLVLTGAAFAQSPQTTQTAAVPLTCWDFARNADGSWSALHSITVNGVSFGPGVAFRPGVSFGGVDLAATLNQQCPLR
jgi:ABC-type glycerol-3-phosphate transport system substrate-binding protein